MISISSAKVKDLQSCFPWKSYHYSTMNNGGGHVLLVRVCYGHLIQPG